MSGDRTTRREVVAAVLLTLLATFLLLTLAHVRTGQVIADATNRTVGTSVTADPAGLGESPLVAAGSGRG